MVAGLARLRGAHDDSPAFDVSAIVDGASSSDATIRAPRGLVIKVPRDVDVERLQALLVGVPTC